MVNEKMNGEFMVEESTRKGLLHIPILAMIADVIHFTHYIYIYIFFIKHLLKKYTFPNKSIYYNPKHLLKCEMERCVSKLSKKENL